MGFALALLAAAAAQQIPDVPIEVKLIEENRAYVMRTFAGGLPLYTFDRDEPGKSSCEGACATSWPPLVAPADARPIGKWAAVTRADGSKQWAYDGRPVYTFVHDEEAMPRGDGSGGVWHLLKPIPAR